MYLLDRLALGELDRRVQRTPALALGVLEHRHVEVARSIWSSASAVASPRRRRLSIEMPASHGEDGADRHPSLLAARALISSPMATQLVIRSMALFRWKWPPAPGRA